MKSQVRIRLFDILHFVRDLLVPLLKNSKPGSHMVHVPNFWGMSGSEDRVGMTTLFKSLILGRWVTKVL